jgi:cytochrome b subunit of formate dehydrogenase
LRILRRGYTSHLKEEIMLKRVLIISLLILIFLILSILGINYLKVSLFQTSPWILVIPICLGLLTGGLITMFKKKKLIVPTELLKRHSLASYMEHWGTALGLFVLIISGFLLLIKPTLFQMNLHFLGLFFVLLFGCYFLADFFISKKYNDLLPNYVDLIDGTLRKYLYKTRWVDNEKYLSSQKSSFLSLTTFGIGITITGMIKIVGMLWNLPLELIQISTRVHDIAAALFVIVVLIHIILAALVRDNRRLLVSWFTGIVPEDGPKNNKTCKLKQSL